MKLYELIDVYDYNRESETKKIQICRPNENWEDCDEVSTCSAILIPFYGFTVKEIGAIDEDVIRVDLEWDEKVFKWGKENDRTGH